jgi:hypothetical protein
VKRRAGNAGLDRARDPNTPTHELRALLAKHPEAVRENPALPLLLLSGDEQGARLYYEAQILFATREIASLWPKLGQRARQALLAEAGRRLLQNRRAPHANPSVEAAFHSLLAARQRAADTGDFHELKECRDTLTAAFQAHARVAPWKPANTDNVLFHALGSSGDDALARLARAHHALENHASAEARELLWARERLLSLLSRK